MRRKGRCKAVSILSGQVIYRVIVFNKFELKKQPIEKNAGVMVHIVTSTVRSWSALPPVLVLILILQLFVTACGNSESKKSEGPAQRPPLPAPDRSFRATLASFTMDGGQATYALGNSLRELSAETYEDEKYYCSVNGSAFERCQQRGTIPVSRLRPGLNVFQAEVRVDGRESGNLVYHEFVFGMTPPK